MLPKQESNYNYKPEIHSNSNNSHSNTNNLNSKSNCSQLPNPNSNLNTMYNFNKGFINNNSKATYNMNLPSTLTGFTTPQNKFNITSNAFRSQSSSKRDDFYTFSKMNKRELFGYDNEKLTETIINLKKEINLKNKELNSMKVELNLLNIEDKKKLKVIENILSSSGKSLEEIVAILDEGKQIDRIDLTANSVIKLREIYVINFLKSQVGQLKVIIKDKDDEIRMLRENSKVSKITQLDNENQTVINENAQIKQNLEKLTIANEALKANIANLKIEHESLYKKYLKKGRELEKINSHVKEVEEQNKLLAVIKKKANEESNKCKVTMINMKADLKNKTEKMNEAKDSEDKINKVEKEKESLIKKIDIISKEKVKLSFQNK